MNSRALLVFTFAVLVKLLSLCPVYAQDHMNVTVSPDTGAGFSETFIFRITNTEDPDFTEIMRVIIGENRDDSTALFMEVALGSSAAKIEIGEEGRFSSATKEGTVQTNSSGTLQNAYVSIDLGRARYNRLDDALELRLPITFKESEFSGQAQKVFASLIDVQLVQTPYREIGQYTVLIEPNRSDHKPRIVSVTADNEGKDTEIEQFQIVIEDKDGWWDIEEVDFYITSGRDQLWSFGATTVDLAPGGFFDLSIETMTFNLHGPRGTKSTEFGSDEVLKNQWIKMPTRWAGFGRRTEERLAIIVPVEFKNPMIGTWKLFAQARDRGGNSSSLKRVGKYTVPGNSIAPRPIMQTPVRARLTAFDLVNGDGRLAQPFELVSYWSDRNGADDIAKLTYTFRTTRDLYTLHVFPVEERMELVHETTGDTFRLNTFDAIFFGAGQFDLSLDHMTIEEISPSILKHRLPVKFFLENPALSNQDFSVPQTVKVLLSATDHSGNTSSPEIFSRLVLFENNGTSRPTKVEPFYDEGLGRTFTFTARDIEGVNTLREIQIAFVDKGWEGDAPPEEVTYPFIRFRLPERSIGIKQLGTNRISPLNWETGSILDRAPIISGGTVINPQLSQYYTDGTAIHLRLDISFRPGFFDAEFQEIWVRTVDEDRGTSSSRWRVLGGYKVQ